jgi:hypothetical protein
MITLQVLKAFDYQGRGYRAGDLVEMEPIHAAIHARKGYVSLGKVRKPLHTANLAAEAPVRSRRSYKRRDLVPEP